MSKYLAAVLVVVRAVSGQVFTNSDGVVITSPVSSGSSLSISTSTWTDPDCCLTDIACCGGNAFPTLTATAPTTTPITTPNTSVKTASSSMGTHSPSYSTSIAYSCVTTVSAIGPFVTIYQTVYVDVCPTGTIYNTYTITDTCGCTHSTDYTRPTGCPSGFTVTTKVCDACPGAPTITVTQPIKSPAQASQTYKPTTYAHSNSNSTPASTRGAPGATGANPSIVTTGAATVLSRNSILGSFLVLTMTFVAGLMWVL
jgi:hypothetical protein